jgi:hypothetical protein
MRTDTLAMFRAIANADPDGRENEPTERDYVLFRTWVTLSYGAETYAAYMRHDWGPVREV